MWHPNTSLREVHYVGNPYLNTYDSVWPHHPYLSWETNEDIPQPPQEKKLSLERVMAELVESQVEFVNSQAQFMNKTRATLKIQLAQLERLEVQVGQMAKIFLEEQQRSLPTLEKPIREEVDAKGLVELVAKEEGSTSTKPNEIRKEVKILPKMILWG